MKCPGCGKKWKKPKRKLFINTGPTQRIFINTGPTQRKVNPETVAKALGAQKICFGKLCSECTQKFFKRMHPKT